MKKFFLIIIASFCVIVLHAQTQGTLNVTVKTSTTGGNYAPRNVMAVWIEDSSGKFVKTLLAYADKRKQHLNIWEASTNTSGSMYNSVDAITGATQSSHGTRTCKWNSTDYSGKIVADGDYKVRMELTDKNATGNIASFTFTKGSANQKLTPANVPSFSSISLDWTGTVTSLDPELNGSNTILIYPNPGKDQFSVLGENVKNVIVRNVSGKVVCRSKVPVFNLAGKPAGIYFVSVETSGMTVLHKIIKE